LGKPKGDQVIDFDRRRIINGDHEGQMSSEERRLIYNIVIARKPKVLFEIGYMLGGGSTYYIASALLKNEQGVLHTADISKECFDYVTLVYGNELVALGKHIKFYLGNAMEVFTPIIEATDVVDFVLFDGGGNPNENVMEYNMFLPKLGSGSVLAFHDWDVGKCELIKPIIKQSSLREIITLKGALSANGFSMWEMP